MLRLHVINMHSKYDNMHRNRMFYALICINSHEIKSICCMLSVVKSIKRVEHFFYLVALPSFHQKISYIVIYSSTFSTVIHLSHLAISSYSFVSLCFIILCQYYFPSKIITIIFSHSSIHKKIHIHIQL